MTVTERRRTALLIAALKDDAEPLRCGVCDQRSAQPVCRRCAAALNVERFGPVESLRREQPQSPAEQR